MSNEAIVKILIEQVLVVEQNKRNANPNEKIVQVHLDPEMFLKMAYLFIGLNQK